MTPDTLTQLIAKVQAQLLDNGTLFTTATVTAATRQALADMNITVPQNAAVLIDSIASQKEYELTDQDPAAARIFGVLLQGDNDVDLPLAFYTYSEDSRVFFRLNEALPAGETIIVRYTLPHTVSGLDGAGESTLTDALNSALINGACYFCCIIRSMATVESNNVQTDVSKTWANHALVWKSIYRGSLHDARTQPTPRGEPPTASWNDAQHSDVYP